MQYVSCWKFNYCKVSGCVSIRPQAERVTSAQRTTAIDTLAGKEAETSHGNVVKVLFVSSSLSNPHFEQSAFLFSYEAVITI